MPYAVDAMILVLGADRPAIRTIHHKATADGGSGFVNTAVHPHCVQRHAPTVFAVLHDVQTFGCVRGEVTWDAVLRLQDHREPAAYRLACGALSSALLGTGGRRHV